MNSSGHPPQPAEPWHALFAALPADVVPLRKPVASPEILARPEGAAIAGWEQLMVHISAGCALQKLLSLGCHHMRLGVSPEGS
jgi:hypothetical protein